MSAFRVSTSTQRHETIRQYIPALNAATQYRRSGLLLRNILTSFELRDSLCNSNATVISNLLLYRLVLDQSVGRHTSQPVRTNIDNGQDKQIVQNDEQTAK
jgi:hypothetical protein